MNSEVLVGGPIKQNEEQKALARRNVRTALWLALMAFGFVAAFFWSMSHRGG